MITLTNPSNLPPTGEIEHMEEPVVKASIYTPPEYIGPIMELCQDKRGEFVNMTYLEKTRVLINYVMPLNEIVYDFFDGLKSRSRGYASFDYEFDGYRTSDLVKRRAKHNRPPRQGVFARQSDGGKTERRYTA